MVILAIDLGTTNSLASIWSESAPVMIANGLEQYSTPSVVGLDDQGRVLVGEVARLRLTTHPQVTVARFKQFMGTDKVFTLGTLEFTAPMLSSLVLKSLKTDAQIQLKQSITQAVISVPAYFNDIQRQATVSAAHLAGLEVLRLVNEPTAAAIAYGLHLQQAALFMVFDLGGGTFDVSIVDYFEGVMQISASTGDNRLGGEDFLDQVLAWFCEQTQLDFQGLSLQTQAQLRHICGRALHALSIKHSVMIALNHQGQLLQKELTREMLTRCSKTLLQRLRQPIERALIDAQLKKSDVDSLVLVGGASRMPMVRALIARMLGGLPLSTLNPDEAIVRGAALQIGLMQDDLALVDKVLTDVAPYSLGIGIANANPREASQLFHPIIERNTAVPVSRSHIFYTATDNQELIRCRLYQGESRLASHNVCLGEVVLPVPPMPEGVEKIEVRFTYDINGLLEVDAKVLSTGLQKIHIVDGWHTGLSAEQVQAQLAALAPLKIHPRHEQKNAALLAKAYALFEMISGHQRLLLGQVLQAFELALEEQNPRHIDDTRAQLCQCIAAYTSLDLE